MSFVQGEAAIGGKLRSWEQCQGRLVYEPNTELCILLYVTTFVLDRHPLCPFHYIIHHFHLPCLSRQQNLLTHQRILQSLDTLLNALHDRRHSRRPLPQR